MTLVGTRTRSVTFLYREVFVFAFFLLSRSEELPRVVQSVLEEQVEGRWKRCKKRSQLRWSAREGEIQTAW